VTSSTSAVPSLPPAARALPSAEKTSETAPPRGPWRGGRALPVATSQRLIPSSNSAPLAAVRPSGEKATEYTPPRWDRYLAPSSPEATPHGPSALPAGKAIVLPSPEKARDGTPPDLSPKRRSSLPEATSHRPTVPLDQSPEASVLPLGAKATTWT